MRRRAIVHDVQATGIGDVTADAEVLLPIAEKVAVVDAVNFAQEVLLEAAVVAAVLRRESADAKEVVVDKVRGEVISAAAMEIVGVIGIATVLRGRNLHRKLPD